MRLDQADQLLEPGYLPFESGYLRLDDGQIHVAAQTTMPGCKGAMIDWWFGFLETTEQYKWWHPKDHVRCERAGERGTGRGARQVRGDTPGGEHHVHEFIGGGLMKLKIRFREPSEYLDTSRFAEAGVSTAVCARVGALEAPVWAGHLIHLVRDTDYGCEMRSRFWLGDYDPPEVAATREARIALLPDRAGAGLLRHCQEEMGYLAAFLPRLHTQDTGRP